MIQGVSWRYYQHVHTKMSKRDLMQMQRTCGVTPGCIVDPRQGYRRFERWFKIPRKAINLDWRVRGVKTWKDMQVAHKQHMKDSSNTS